MIDPCSHVDMERAIRERAWGPLWLLSLAQVIDVRRKRHLEVLDVIVVNRNDFNPCNWMFCAIAALTATFISRLSIHNQDYHTRCK